MSKKLPTWLVVIGYTLLAVELLMVLYALCGVTPPDGGG